MGEAKRNALAAAAARGEPVPPRYPKPDWADLVGVEFQALYDEDRGHFVIVPFAKVPVENTTLAAGADGRMAYVRVPIDRDGAVGLGRCEEAREAARKKVVIP